ncbi:sigma-70 family RNA polymerase sigma factor [Aerosakkonema funiforme]|uniref:sigma-70 family RNA polymerase sigma factor n=1 Tax=Aerosakkonema funiforme TaxID=1246630 RepID=UPI0035BB9FEB
MFAQFLALKDSDGNLTDWIFDGELKRNMKNQVDLSLAASEGAWVQYWLKAAEQKPSIPLSGRHLSAYLQESSFWATKTVYPKFATPDLTFVDCFQMAGEVVTKNAVKILKGYDPHKSSPKTWSQMRIESNLKERLLKRRRIDGETDWKLLRDNKPEKFTKILKPLVDKELDIIVYQLAVECFQKYYSKKMINTNKRLPDPTPEQWQMMVQDYNELRLSRGIEDKVTETEIQNLLETCVSALRAKVKQPKASSLDEADIPELLIDDRIEEEEEQQIQQHHQVKSVLSSAFSLLSEEQQTLLILEYGLELGQTKIADIFSIQQYQVSRKIKKSCEPLLEELVRWSSKESGNFITQQENKNLSKTMHEWLRRFCKNPFYEFLDRQFKPDSIVEIAIFKCYLYYTLSELVILIRIYLLIKIEFLVFCFVKKLESQQPLKIEEVADRLEISVAQVKQELNEIKQNLLFKLKIYIQKMLNLPLDITTTSSFDSSLSKFIDNYLSNAHYADFRQHISRLQ